MTIKEAILGYLTINCWDSKHSINSGVNSKFGHKVGSIQIDEELDKLTKEGLIVFSQVKLNNLRDTKGYQTQFHRIWRLANKNSSYVELLTFAGMV
jgi:DNA-binding PadR family transcriptional regulator